MKYIIFVLFLVFGNQIHIQALTIGSNASPKDYGCKMKQLHQCLITDNSWYEDYVAYAVTTDPTPREIVAIPGTNSATYFYIPDNDNPNIGYGVINGFIQYFPNNPFALIHTYTDDNSLIFNNFIDWSNALISIGIQPGILLD